MLVESFFKNIKRKNLLISENESAEQEKSIAEKIEYIEAKSTLIPCFGFIQLLLQAMLQNPARFKVPKGSNIANLESYTVHQISRVFNQSKMTIFYMMLQLDNCPLISSSVLSLQYNFFSTQYNNTT